MLGWRHYGSILQYFIYWNVPVLFRNEMRINGLLVILLWKRAFYFLHMYFILVPRIIDTGFSLNKVSHCVIPYIHSMKKWPLPLNVNLLSKVFWSLLCVFLCKGKSNPQMRIYTSKWYFFQNQQLPLGLLLRGVLNWSGSRMAKTMLGYMIYPVNCTLFVPWNVPW